MKNIKRTFIPGSEWFYLKLYTGENTADDLLLKAIKPIIKKIKNEECIKKWFFIRYADPDFHLRCRILLNDTLCVGKIIDLFYKELSKSSYSHLIWKIQIDTYNRELERYDWNLIEEAESFFFVDSECVLSIIDKIERNENYRWMIALKLIDELLSDFRLNLGEKKNLMEKLSDLLKIEFGFDENNSKQFNMKFRENRKSIEAVLNDSFDENKFASLLLPIKKRSKALIPIVQQIDEKVGVNRKMEELLKSYLHMMLNRLFRSKNRKYELLIYDFMFRYYKAEIARKFYIKLKSV